MTRLDHANHTASSRRSHKGANWHVTCESISVPTDEGITANNNQPTTT